VNKSHEKKSHLADTCTAVVDYIVLSL